MCASSIEPAAVLIGVDAYQARQDELEDLRSEILAIERLSSLDNTVTVSLEDMEVHFSQATADDLECSVFTPL
ncbi:hypothetical protein [Pseudomonas fluorescens]|uniref:Uncharacterized protein n=1 Tax=Pseudomonas fluorescens TaxID=294 RepID=A0A5E6ZML5_PSEFL|nr:hypothetical protein [Pseudomonas fluorescens]VVN66899.1 hypothetical protein PS710_00161 [Pseudomonas fluorescens]